MAVELCARKMDRTDDRDDGSLFTADHRGDGAVVVQPTLEIGDLSRGCVLSQDDNHRYLLVVFKMSGMANRMERRSAPLGAKMGRKVAMSGHAHHHGRSLTAVGLRGQAPHSVV